LGFFSISKKFGARGRATEAPARFHEAQLGLAQPTGGDGSKEYFHHHHQCSFVGFLPHLTYSRQDQRGPGPADDARAVREEGTGSSNGP